MLAEACPTQAIGCHASPCDPIQWAGAKAPATSFKTMKPTNPAKLILKFNRENTCYPLLRGAVSVITTLLLIVSLPSAVALGVWLLPHDFAYPMPIWLGLDLLLSALILAAHEMILVGVDIADTILHFHAQCVHAPPDPAPTA